MPRLGLFVVVFLAFYSMQVNGLKILFDKEACTRVNPVDFFVAAVAPIDMAIDKGLLEQCKDILTYRYVSGLGSYSSNIIVKFYGALFELCEELSNDLILMEKVINESIIRKSYPIRHREYDQVCLDIMDLVESVYRQATNILNEILKCRRPSIKETRDCSSATARYQINKIMSLCKSLETFILSFKGIIEQHAPFFASVRQMHKEAMRLVPYDSEDNIASGRSLEGGDVF